jgi:hypothetical protein
MDSICGPGVPSGKTVKPIGAQAGAEGGQA